MIATLCFGEWHFSKQDFEDMFLWERKPLLEAVTQLMEKAKEKG